MTKEEIISRMNELSDRLFARASECINDPTVGRILIVIANEINDTFNDFETDDCEGEGEA